MGSVVADIGGGQGHVLASLLEKHPTLRSRRPARHLATLPHHPSTSRTRAILRLAMHRTGRRELPGKPFRPQD
ncbi:hypothetical protein AMK22_07820 [Streptomyces sp. CB01580]|nr:hypothetical protein AMK22_07820 [Streptomyces sp. CB01580]